MAATRFVLLQFNGSLLALLAIGSRKVRPSEVMRKKLVGMSRLLRLMRTVLLVESPIPYELRDGQFSLECSEMLNIFRNAQQM